MKAVRDVHVHLNRQEKKEAQVGWLSYLWSLMVSHWTKGNSGIVFFYDSTTLTGDNAHPDIRARGFYRPGQNSYFDIKFLNPNSESYLSSSTEKVYERAETQKRRLYNERILNVEHGSFCPLVYSVTGGSGPEARTFFRLLCEKIAYKTQQNYSDVVNFLRCKLSFVIRKLVLLCIRGTRSSINAVDKSSESDFEFACFVSKLS